MPCGNMNYAPGGQGQQVCIGYSAGQATTVTNLANGTQTSVAYSCEWWLYYYHNGSFTCIGQSNFDGGGWVTDYSWSGQSGSVGQAGWWLWGINRPTRTVNRQATARTMQLYASMTAYWGGVTLVYGDSVTVAALPVPSNVTGLTGSGGGTASHVLSWTAPTAVPAPAGYRVYTSVNGGAYALETTVTTLNTTLGSRTAGSTYTYSVRSYNVAGEASGATVQLYAVVNVPTEIKVVSYTAPSTVVVSAKNPNNYTATIEFTQSANNSTWTDARTVSAAAGATVQSTFTNAPSPTAYYRARITSPYATSYTGSVSQATLQKPNGVTNLDGTGTGTATHVLTWGAPSGGSAVAGYKIYESKDGAANQLVATITTLTHTLSSRTNGSKYTYYVVAYNAAGDSATQPSIVLWGALLAPSDMQVVSFTPPLSVTVQAKNPNNSPCNMQFMVSDDGVNWVDGTNVANVAAGATAQDTFANSPSPIAYFRTVFFPAQLYKSPYSAIVSQQTMALPTAPTTVTVVPESNTSHRISWSGATGAASYDLYRSINGASFTLVTNLTGTNYLDTTANDYYLQYYVVAKNAAGTAQSAIALTRYVGHSAETGKNHPVRYNGNNFLLKI